MMEEKTEVMARHSRNHTGIDKLFSALKTNKTSMVESLLSKNNLDINHVDNARKTALFYAIINHNFEATKYLISQGIDVNHMNYVAYHRDNLLCSCYEPPLVTASRVEDLEIVKLLIHNNAKVNAQSEIRQRENLVELDGSALHFACEASRLEIVKEILAYNGDTNLPDKSGELPIHKIVRCNRECGRQTEILKLLCEHKSNLDSLNKVDCSILYLATFYGCYKKVKMLLSYGADINMLGTRDNSYGTPLHVAAAKDRMDLADILIMHGAQLNVTNSLKCTPLQLNINVLSKSQIAQFLIYHGAKCNGKDKWNLTLMASCIRNMRLDCESLAKLFVYAGYDLNGDYWLKPMEMRNSIEADDTPEVPIPPGRVQRLCDWLREQQCNPLHLGNICRITIRLILQEASGNRSIVPLVQQLPLPKALQDFILLKSYVNFDLI